MICCPVGVVENARANKCGSEWFVDARRAGDLQRVNSTDVAADPLDRFNGGSLV